MRYRIRLLSEYRPQSRMTLGADDLLTAAKLACHAVNRPHAFCDSAEIYDAENPEMSILLGTMIYGQPSAEEWNHRRYFLVGSGSGEWRNVKGPCDVLDVLGSS